MLPCARKCAARRIWPPPTAPLDSVTPAEPLLFLYPQWVHSSLQQRRSQSSDSISRTYNPQPKRRSSGPRRANAPVRCLQQSALQKGVSTQQSRSLKTFSKQQDRVETSDLADSRRRDSDVGGEVSVEQQQDGIRVRQVMNNRPKQPAGRFRSASFDALATIQQLSRMPNRDTMTVPEQTELGTSSEFVVWLTGTANQNMWLDIHGCKIFVTDDTIADGTNLKLLLQGPHKTRQASLRHIQSLQAQFEAERDQICEKPALSEAGEDETTSKVFVRVDQIDRPKIWTLRSFHEFVAAIVQYQLPRSIERKLYPGTESYDQTAASMLKSLFASNELKPFFSGAAFRQALAFLRHRTHLAPITLDIWRCALAAGIIPDQLSFNSELKRSLSVNNFARFAYLMKTMMDYEVQPNAETWALVISACRNRGNRHSIAKWLYRDTDRHLRTEADRQIVGQAFIRAELQHEKISADNFANFMEYMTYLLGKDWLTPSIVADMIIMCLESKTLHNVQHIIGAAQAWNTPLTEETWLPILDAVRRTRRFEDAIAMFKIAFTHNSGSASQAQIDLIFKASWRLRMLNTCYLIWRYAAVHGIVSFAMQRLVLSSIVQNPGLQPSTKYSDDDEENSEPKLNPVFAAILLDMNTTSLNLRAYFPILAKLGHDCLIDLLCTWTPKGDARQEQWHLAHLLLERSLMAWATFKPMKSDEFLQRLDQAYTLDTRWRTKKFLASASISEVTRQMAEVRLTERISPDSVSSQWDRLFEETRGRDYEELAKRQIIDKPASTSATLTMAPGDCSEDISDEGLQRSHIVHYHGTTMTALQSYMVMPVLTLTMANTCIIDVLYQQLIRELWT